MRDRLFQFFPGLRESTGLEIAYVLDQVEESLAGIAELPDVLVRIEAVMRRYNAANNRVQADNKNTSVAAPGKKLTYGSIVMDTALMTVSIKGEEVTLTSKEYEILKLMLENQNKLFSKANLYESVWNEEYFPDDQSLKVHMSNLRSKLRRYDEFDYIETIWGMGYRLRKL